jgi:hypothetical protein
MDRDRIAKELADLQDDLSEPGQYGAWELGRAN